VKRGPNGTDEKAVLIRVPLELDAAITAAAHARGLSVAEWIRQVLARAVKREAK
jgi:predicted HicB family RNase H-like nuclease